MLLSAIVNPFSLQNSDADPNANEDDDDDDDVCASSPPPVVTLADVFDGTAFARPSETEEEYASFADEKSDGDDGETT
jgi:hypothetical protein